MSSQKQPFDVVPESHRVPFTWMDGACVPTAEAVAPLMSNTLHYGLGVFEGIRAYDGVDGPAVFRLREHMERLVASARMIRLEVPFSVDELMAAAVSVLQKNQMRSGYLRPIVFMDDGKRGLGASNNRVRVAICTWPWGAYLGEEGLQRGIRATVSSTTRMNARAFMPKGKINGQYVNSILAKRAAQQAGFDEAILLDDVGNVAEATGENIFIVKKGEVITPPSSMPILLGITRDAMMTIARSMSLSVREEAFQRDTLVMADEVFFTGTAAEVTPVREIDGYAIGNGSRGPITARLQERFFDIVKGKAEDASSWRTRYTL
jgi:branched-chain amino acid aminotransferase